MQSLTMKRSGTRQKLKNKKKNNPIVKRKNKNMATQQAGEIKYLTPIAVDTKKKKYCRFQKKRYQIHRL
jgi:hypothetical protein